LFLWPCLQPRGSHACTVRMNPRREVDISPLLTSRCTRSCGRRAGGVRFPGSSAHTDPGRSGSMAIRTWLVGIGGAGFLAASTSFPASAQEPVAWEADLEFHT